MITKLFVTRPTLAVVAVAIAVIGGLLAIFGLREQELPNVGVPIVDIIIFYPGATPTEMRDQIVRPIEDQLAGAPSLEHTQTNLQQGFASIVAQFGLKSSRTEDLVEVQRRMQAAQSQLPSDLTTPRIETIDPGESAVVSLAVTSKSLSTGALSALIQNQLIPAIEQVPGVGYVQANGIVTPSLQVEVDPAKLRDQNLTINDVIGAIAVNNIRLPGGILYGANAETGINIRGDIHGPQSVAALQIPQPAASPGAAAVRVGNVASVRDAYEPERIYAYVNGQPNFFLTVQKSVGANEVDTAKGVINRLPQLQQRFPGIGFTVIDNQSAYTQALLTGVFRTLLEGIVLVAIVMIFFLRSWRNAAAVLIAIPTSLLATLIVMHLEQFTLDTVSLLAMTLITGILVDDSIVVLENSERHRELGESPFRAAINGRLEIGLAAHRHHPRGRRRVLADRVLAGHRREVLERIRVGGGRRDAGLAVRVVHDHAVVGGQLVAPLAANAPPPDRSVLARFRARAAMVCASARYRGGLRHPVNRRRDRGISLAGALALVPLGIIGFEFIPADDRGELFVQITLPSGTPLTVTRGMRLIAARPIVSSRSTTCMSETSVAGGCDAPVGGYRRSTARSAQIHVCLKNKRQHCTDYWVGRTTPAGAQAAAERDIGRHPDHRHQGGNSQPIDYLVSTLAGEPDAYAKQVLPNVARHPRCHRRLQLERAAGAASEHDFNRDEPARSI